MTIHERIIKDGIGVSDNYTPKQKGDNQISILDILSAEKDQRKLFLDEYLSRVPNDGEWLTKVFLRLLKTKSHELDRRIMETIEMIDDIGGGK